MKIVENTETSACVKSLKIEVPADDLRVEIDKTYDEFVKNVDIPGFRRGRAPRKILKMRYGKHLEKQALQQAAEQAFEDACKELDLRAASAPQFDEFGEIEEGKEFIVNVNAEFFPEFELADYTKIEPSKKKSRVTEKQVVEQLEELRKAAASFVSPAEPRGAQEGDVLTINSNAQIGEDPFPEATADGINLELGTGRYLPGLEDGLVGMKVDEEKDITVSIPDDYHVEDRRGKEAVLHVKVVDIRERELPELDDEFAKDLGDFETLDQLKEQVKESLKANADARQMQETREKVREELLKLNQFALPPSMIEARFNYINAVQDMDRRNAGASGEESGLVSQNREQAEKESRLTLILDEISKKENIEVTPEEYATFISALAERNQSDPAWYYQQIEHYNLRPYYERLALEEKVVDHVIALGKGEVESVAQKASEQESGAADTDTESDSPAPADAETKPEAKDNEESE